MAPAMEKQKLQDTGRFKSSTPFLVGKLFEHDKRYRRTHAYLQGIYGV